MNLGRHNHGPVFFNDPWSGFYQLAAPFYTQAQFTQFTEIGWKFIEGGAGHTGCTGEMNKAGQPQCDLTYASLASDASDPDGSEFSMVIVSLSPKPEPLRVALAGGLAKFAGTPLQHWSSTETAYFTEQPALTIPAGAPLSLSIPPYSVVTISNRKQKGGWAKYTVPERTRYPLPFDGGSWEAQPIDAPCLNSECRVPASSIISLCCAARVLSLACVLLAAVQLSFVVSERRLMLSYVFKGNPIYGAFEIATDATAATTDHKVCRQAVPANPGGNAWTHRHNGWPFTTLPSGSNLANAEISVNAKIVPSGGAMEVVTVCGRVPIWSPSACQMKTSDGNGWAPGVCLSIMANNSGGGTSNNCACTVERQPCPSTVGRTYCPSNHASKQCDSPCSASTTSSTSFGGTKLNWRLTEASNMYSPSKCGGFTVLASGEDVAGNIEDWRALVLSFSGTDVVASIDGKVVAGGSAKPVATTMSAGVAGFGSAWNIAHFTKLHVAAHPKHPAAANSFIFDVIPSDKTISTFTGYAGMILDLSGGKCEVRGDCGGAYPATAPKLLISKLGRFKTAGNKGTHKLGVVDAASGAWIVGGNATSSVATELSVDMASCVSDVLGFCYSAALPLPVELKSGGRYFIVSSETAGEAFVNMTMSVTGADYGTYRDGDSLMTYHLPSKAGAAPMAAGHSLCALGYSVPLGFASPVLSHLVSFLREGQR
jgi:hypothetical protein